MWAWLGSWAAAQEQPSVSLSITHPQQRGRASAALQKGNPRHREGGAYRAICSIPNTFEPRNWQPHPTSTSSVQTSGLLLPQPPRAGSFWGGEGEAGWGSSGGCRRAVLYPGAGELRERRVGVLAAVPAAQLPQGLQAGRAAAQALLASSSVHQTETGQLVTQGSTPAPGQRLWVPGWGCWGGRGLCVGKMPPKCALALGSVFSTRRREAVSLCMCVCVCVYSCLHGDLVPHRVFMARK